MNWDEDANSKNPSHDSDVERRTLSAGWIALHRSDEALALLENYPNAFLLLTQIALRARWKDCPITGIKAGEALIGDWRKAGLRSPKAYQVAKERLERCGLVVFQGGNKGTRATLVNSRVFSVSRADRGNQEGNPREIEGESKENRGGSNKKGTQIEGYTETSLFTEATTAHDGGGELFDYWKTKEALPKFKAISAERKRKLKARLKDPFFKENWKAAIDKVQASAFLTGSGDNGWRADIDWFLSPGNVMKVMECKYDAPSTKSAAAVNTGRRTSTIEEV